MLTIIPQTLLTVSWAGSQQIPTQKARGWSCPQEEAHNWTASWQNQQSDCAPSENSDQPGHPPSLIRVFVVRMKKAWVLSYPLSAQRRLWSDWAVAQAPLSLCLAHRHFVGFVMSWLIWPQIDSYKTARRDHLIHWVDMPFVSYVGRRLSYVLLSQRNRQCVYLMIMIIFHISP